jgi:hypothetical protein
MEKPSKGAGKDAAENIDKVEAFDMEIGDNPMVENRLMPADPEFGEGSRYCWPLDRSDAESMLLHGQYYDDIEGFLEEHPFYCTDGADNKEWIEELEEEKREELREAGAMDWEYRFFACSAIYAALVKEWLTPIKGQDRPRKEIHWATWHRLFIFLIRPDAGPMLAALLERNNLVEPYREEMRKGFLDILLDWDICCGDCNEAEFYRKIGNDKIAREGLTRALQLLRIDQSTIASRIDRSLAEKGFAPLWDLLKSAHLPGSSPPALGGGTFGPTMGNDGSRHGGSPPGKPYSILSYVKDLALSKQTEEELFNSILSSLTEFEPMNVLVSFDEEAGNMSRLALFDLFADFMGNRKSFLLPLLNSVKDESWIDQEFESLDEFLLFVKGTVQVPKETKEAILRHYTVKVGKLPLKNSLLTELTTVCLFLGLWAIGPVSHTISQRSFLIRSNRNLPAFAMISANNTVRIGFQDRDLPRRAPGLSPSIALRQVDILAKNGDNETGASSFSAPTDELAAMDSVATGLETSSLSPVVRPVWETRRITNGGSLLRLSTNGGQATTAGSIGGKHEVSYAHAKVAKQRKALGEEVLVIEQDHLTPSVIGLRLGIRNPNVQADHSTVWSLSKTAHNIKSKASKDEIFFFDLEYTARNRPTMGEYLDEVAKKTRLHVIDKLTPDMVYEMGFDDPAELNKSLSLGMKREGALIVAVTKRWGISGEEVIPVLFAKRVAGIVEQGTHELLQLRNEIMLPQGRYTSLEEEMRALDARHEERVQSRFSKFKSYLSEQRSNLLALQTPYTPDSAVYQHIQAQIDRVDNNYQQAAATATQSYGIKLGEHEFSLESIMCKTQKIRGTLSHQEAMSRLLTIHNFGNFHNDEGPSFGQIRDVGAMGDANA